MARLHLATDPYPAHLRLGLCKDNTLPSCTLVCPAVLLGVQLPLPAAYHVWRLPPINETCPGKSTRLNLVYPEALRRPDVSARMAAPLGITSVPAVPAELLCLPLPPLLQAAHQL